jgi:hypothetical protein
MDEAKMVGVATAIRMVLLDQGAPSRFDHAIRRRGLHT